jgi:hypothetical protein
MSAIQDTDGALTGLLDTIDDKKLRRVIEVIEATGQRPVLEPALSAMRPRLRKLRPLRPLTLARLLTVPLELVLVDDDSPHVSFAIGRGRLHHWQAAALDRLDANMLEAAGHAIAGRSADDRNVALTVGRDVWPNAAKALAACDQADADSSVAAERLRVADCLAMSPTLLPLLDQLLPLPAVLDAKDKTLLAQIVELGAAGPPDRLATVGSALLRAARQPWTLAAALLDVAAVALQGRLRRELEQLLLAHRASLERLVDRHVLAAKGAAAQPTTELALDLERLADALVPADGAISDTMVGPGDASALRQRAAAMATDHCAAVIESVLVPLPAMGSSERAAAQRVREAEARALARLAGTARRLAPACGIKRVAEVAIERLVDVGAARREGRQQPVNVEDARLIEILAGPDIAWHYLRPDDTPAASNRARRGTHPATQG